MTGSHVKSTNSLRTSSNMDKCHGRHFQWVLEHNMKLKRIARDDSEQVNVTIGGDDLSMADMIAVSYYKAQSRITTDEAVLDRVDASVDFLAQQLAQGTPIYGITTGFGGSAETRTSSTVDLQKALVQLLQTGILLPSDTGADDHTATDSIRSLNKHSLPRSAVRGAMLGRCHSLMRGHSAVRREVVETMMKLLNMDFVPVVPLRGSISASGDLMPLAYIAGALEGNPGIYISCPAKNGYAILPAGQALQRAGITPLTLGPKEGLGIANGTIVSGTVAILGFHETQYLALLAQALTGMCTEALRGLVDNHHPFIAAARPHSGQIEAAANITRFLRGSRLASSHSAGAPTAGLAQDRYALRTASQWIAPYLEDLELVAKQLETELNSTTDNPLIDADNGQVHHGGNFQATSVTSATEKTRLSLQMVGKLIFAQSSELINPMLNGNLPPNLSFDDPSLSFTFKGLDINMAAYMSELGFLANPVSSHVQSAEMHNQAVNSLALISARYTLDAVEVVSMMVSVHLYACCQALDLQALHISCMKDIQAETQMAMVEIFQSLLDQHQLQEVMAVIFDRVSYALREAKTKDLHQQAAAATEATVAPLISLASKSGQSLEAKSRFLSAVTAWQERCENIITSSISAGRRKFASSATSITPLYLSRGSGFLYDFVRNDLKVPLHKGLVEHATCDRSSPEGIQVQASDRYLIGKQVSVIYDSLRSGKIHDVLVESLL